MHPEGRNGEEDREAVEWGRGYRSLSVNHPTKRDGKHKGAGAANGAAVAGTATGRKLG